MRTDWKLRSTCLPLLLIALTIQGITPGAYALTSLSLLRMVWPAAGSDSSSHRAATDDEPDRLPDTVCLPGRPGADLTPLHRLVVPPCLGPGWNGEHVRIARSDPARSSSDRDRVVQRDGRIDARCRLIC